MMQLEFSPKLETARSIVFRGNKPFSSLLVLLVHTGGGVGGGTRTPQRSNENTIEDFGWEPTPSQAAATPPTEKTRDGDKSTLYQVAR